MFHHVLAQMSADGVVFKGTREREKGSERKGEERGLKKRGKERRIVEESEHSITSWLKCQEMAR